MDLMQSPMGGARTANLELISRDGSVTIVDQGVVLLDGIERDGLVRLKFVEGSGIRSTLDVVGPSAATDFELSATGPVYLGDLSLPDAAVRVTSTGIEITAPIKWATDPTTAKLERGAAPGQWRGRIDARETVTCLMTRHEILRTSISADFDMRSGQSSYQVLAVLEGRSIEVPFVPGPPAQLETIFSLLRLETLAAVREYLQEELVRSEAKFAALDSHEEFKPSAGFGGALEDRPARNAFSTHDGQPTFRNEAARNPIAAGYLPTGLRAVRPSEASSNLPPRGYLSQRPPASPQIGAGYLPRSSAPPRVAGGYLPAQRRPEQSAQPGYLPSAWKRREALSLPVAHRSGAVASATLPQEASQADRTAIADFERTAYAVLRCKDLIRAIEAAEARGSTE